ncbi:MAG: hypothetical protein WCO33_02315 [bacterium]
MQSKLKRFLPLIVIGVLVVIAIGVYLISNRTGMPTKNSTEVASFGLGLWQGLIICLTFITSWFDKNIVLYQVSNDGFWYNFGFIFGIMISIGAGAKSSKRKNKL